MEERAHMLWDLFKGCAKWDKYDQIDDKSWSCIISLDVEGFSFGGEGIIIGSERDIEYVYCHCPDGSRCKIV